MTRLLKPAELLYRGINRVRRSLYRAGILKSKRLPVPVISVGGIAAGGSGKTPATIAIARALIANGLRVGILTRGYGRSGEGGVVSKLDPDRYGDEPVLMQRQLPGATVIVGANRYDNAVREPANVFILDDGFQHLQLYRDLDIVIDNSASGLLREGRSALRYADIVLPRRIRLTIPQAVHDRRVFAFAGLADNQQFFKSLDLDVVGTRSFPDHHRYSPADIEAVKRAARDAGAEAIVTTEKDAVKITDPDIVSIPAEFVIDVKDLERIVNAVMPR